MRVEASGFSSCTSEARSFGLEVDILSGLLSVCFAHFFFSGTVTLTGSPSPVLLINRAEQASDLDSERFIRNIAMYLHSDRFSVFVPPLSFLLSNCRVDFLGHSKSFRIRKEEK